MAKCRLRFYSLILVFATNRIAALEFLRASDHVSCTSVTHERLVFAPAYASVSNNIGEVDIDGWLDKDKLNSNYDIDAYRTSRLANDMFTTKADATVVE
ncbi:Hypothetical predicted protein [Cloeon dipterum]|uniref:Uncharacterized protein n=1 Tax=Cloeon dipterum TaxID=197152 RepID=A0A8S1E5A5_9INSE|nr:Hypothetical predicted protein [Cloeon dipterum]